MTAPERDDPNVRADTADPGAEQVARRAELLPEEVARGSADPEAQAAAILAESEQRIEAPSAADPDDPREDDGYEHRESQDTL